MKQLARTALVLGSALAAALTWGSCAIVSSHSDVDRTGNYVSPETFEQVKVGTSTEYVTAILGEPSSKSTLSDGTEIWKWRYTEVRESHGGVIFVVNSRKTTDSVHNSYVEFQDGKVARAWRD